MNKLLTISFGALVLVAALIFGMACTNSESKVSKSNIKVVAQWELPDVLKEISGIAYLAEGKFACIQDEKGVIFIFNTNTLKIEKKIPFAGKGDYEGIALSGTTAYVVRSDGKIYEVVGIDKAQPEVNEYDTPLTEDHNVEGLYYDKKNHRLLLAIKDAEPGDKDYKGIYAFDLGQKEMDAEPVFKIDLKAPAFAALGEKDIEDVIKPSDIAIHPGTGNIYITEGTHPKILIMGESGEIKNLYQMDEDIYAQIEGIVFSPEGELYISNEGKKGSGNIMQVEISSNKSLD